MGGPILFRKCGGKAEIRLNRPNAMNSLTPEMLESLDEMLREVKRDTSVKVLLIRGDQRAFSTGADMGFVRRAIDDHDFYYRFVHRINEVFFALEELPVATVAVVRGYALAGGMELMLACDMALAADDAIIGDHHANYGLMAGAGGTQRLIRKIGRQHAMEMLFAGKWLSGLEAARLGLVLRSVPGENLEEEVNCLVANLVNKGRKCISYTKRSVLRGLELPIRHAMDEELFALFEYFSSSGDPRTGMDAFLAKRRPVFSE